MIEIKNLSKSFSDGPVLSNFSLEVKDGEFVVIFGPNGSGKTTLFSLISNLDCDLEGSIEINGKKSNEAKVGVVFQNYPEALLPWQTLLENVKLVSSKEN